MQIVIRRQFREHGSVWFELKVGRRETRKYHGIFTHSFIIHVSSIQSVLGTWLGTGARETGQMQSLHLRFMANWTYK